MPFTGVEIDGEMFEKSLCGEINCKWSAIDHKYEVVEWALDRHMASVHPESSYNKHPLHKGSY